MPVNGFSLLEIVVSMAVAGILLISVTRFYRDSYKTYDLQEDISDRNQNASYSVKRLAEFLQQAGSALPVSWDSTLMLSPATTPTSGLILGNNPFGGSYTVATAVAGVTKLPIGDFNSFKTATDILVTDGGTGVARRTIRTSGVSDFTNGFKDCPSAPNCGTRTEDSVAISSAVNLVSGSVLYAYRRDTVSLSGTNLKFGNNVMAENIDSLAFTFYKVDGSTTQTWSNMRSAKINVRARTTHQDPKLTTNGGYRKISLSTDVLFRSKP